MGLFPIGADVRTSYVPTTDDLEAMGLFPIGDGVSYTSYVPTTDDLEAMGLFPIGDGVSYASVSTAFEGPGLLSAIGTVSSSQVADTYHLETIGLVPAFGVTGN